MDQWTILSDIIILLGGSLIVGGILSRFGQSPILGYLLAGMILGGPGSIGAISSSHAIEAIAELGIALLLFSLGLEFSIKRLKKLGTKPLIGGVAQILITIIITFFSAKLFGLTTKESIIFGAMIALSSTAVVLRILMEQSHIEMPHGRNSLGVLLTQDMAVVPLALLATILGEGGSTSEVFYTTCLLILSAGGLILALLLLTKVAVFTLGTLTLQRNRELTIIFAIVTGLGSAWAAHAIGISPALGAFVAGMLLGSSPFATQIRADISPLQIVLLTLFFGAAGMVANPVWIINNIGTVMLVVGAITLGKFAIVWIIFLALGQTNRIAAATGLTLSQVGEFAFVLGTISKASGIISSELYALVVSCAIFSFFLSALIVPSAPQLGSAIAKLIGLQNNTTIKTPIQTTPPDVVIIGFGPAGQIAARYLIEQQIKTSVIELNQAGVRKAQNLGLHAELGDATQGEVLEHIRLKESKAVIITIPDFQSAMTILDHVRKNAPHIHIIVRSRYEIDSEYFTFAGANVVTGDEHEVGLSLANNLKQWLINHN